MEEIKESFVVEGKEQKEQLEQAVLRFTESIFRQSGYAYIVDLFSQTYTDPKVKITAYTIASEYLHQANGRGLDTFVELTRLIKERFDDMRTTIDSLHHALFVSAAEKNSKHDE